MVPKYNSIIKEQHCIVIKLVCYALTNTAPRIASKHFQYLKKKKNKRTLGHWIAHLSLAHKMVYWPVAKDLFDLILYVPSTIFQL